MTIFTSFNNFLRSFAHKFEPRFVNAIFVYFLVAFFADQLVNYFYHIPVFVVSALAIFPLLFLSVQYKNPEKWQLNILLLSFIILAIANNAVHEFHKKNISDLLFICLLILFYYYYRNYTSTLKVRFVYIFLIVSLFLVSFTFLAINSQSIYKSGSELIVEESLIDTTEPPESLIDKSEPIHWDVNLRLDYVEYLRVYHNGLFRLPHVASYFFGFLSLFFLYRYWKKKKILDLILIAASLAICLLTGSRAIIAAFILSVILFLFKRKYIVYLHSIIIAGLLMVLGIEHILRYTENTVFYQYFSIIQTITENITRLSRFRIWYSWWVEISNFGVWDFLIGKSYVNAHLANIKNLGYDIWFHNDFLNIFFSYGIWATILYIWFFIKIYRDNRIFIKNNLFIFIFYFSMVFTAVINGFYFYFPVFLLYLFWLMINEDKQTV